MAPVINSSVSNPVVSASSGAPVIVAKDLYKCYPGFPPVLRGVNISVEPGEMVAIMGPSGCGKSTMLHVLGMLHAPDAGMLEILGTDVLTLNREQTAAFRRGNMGFVMQSSNLFDHSTVFENVEFPLIYENVPPEERWERVIRALELVRLSHRVNYRSNRLSGGEQQRVAIARAMVNNPRILLADEPTGALDSRTSRVVMENFRTLAHEGGLAMVIVTHDSSVAEFCDSAYTLEDGILHCRKKNPVPLATGVSNLLGSTPRRMNAVGVVDDFPRPAGANTVQDLLDLHTQGVLARVYSLRGAGLNMFSESQYCLPVPVRRQGTGAFLGALLTLFRHTRGNSTVLWQRWRALPLCRRLPRTLARLAHFAKGARMARWCLDDKVEHLHAFGADAPATAAWVAAGLLRLPFSFSVHGPEVCRKDVNTPRAFDAELAIKIRDAAFVRCDTEETRETLRALCAAAGVPVDGEGADAKLLLLPDGLTLAQPSAEDHMPGHAGMPNAMGVAGGIGEGGATAKAVTHNAPPAASGGTVEILAAGHMLPRKGFSVLLKACAALKKEHVPFRLTIAGQGPCFHGLRGLRWRALFMGLRKHVHFPGHLPHEHMTELYRKSHIFVAPGVILNNGEHDGLPTALVEAMLHGLPVVVSDLPAQTEVVCHEVNGLVVPQGDASALTDALLRLMRFPDKAKAYGQAAQQFIARNYAPEGEATALAEALLRHTG